MAVRPDTLGWLKKNPDAVEEFLLAAPPTLESVLGAHVSALPEEALAALSESLGATAAIHKDLLEDLEKRSPPATVLTDTKAARFPLHKDWAAISYVLQNASSSERTPGLLFQVIEGGDPLGPDLGYGPARFMTAETVLRIAFELSTLSDQEFLEAFDPRAMTEAKVYPGCWQPEDSMPLLEVFQLLVAFYISASERGLAMCLAHG